MRVLVTAASRHGATAEIAEAIARGLATYGLDASARAIDEVGSLDEYDAVVLGSAVYMGRWMNSARDFAESIGRSLVPRTVWLFSSGPLGDPDHLKPEGDPVDVAPLIATTQARGHRVLAGRLDRARLNFREKAVAIGVRAPDGDFRDWEAIDAFAAEIASDLSGQTADRSPLRAPAG